MLAGDALVAARQPCPGLRRGTAGVYICPVPGTITSGTRSAAPPTGPRRSRNVGQIPAGTVRGHLLPQVQPRPGQQGLARLAVLRRRRCGPGRRRVFRILGRVDDVINVAGHRLGTKEIESAALTVPEVAEAAAVPVIDDIRGHVVEVYVSLKPGFQPSTEMEGKVSKAIETEIGKIARPKNV